MKAKFKIAVAVTLTAAVLCSSSARAFNNYATALKFIGVYAYFIGKGFSTASSFFGHWRQAKGTPQIYPKSNFENDNDLLKFLKKQRVEITELIEAGVKSGKYKQNRQYAVGPKQLTGFLGTTANSDFKWSVRGCQVVTRATVKIGKADSRGKILCTFSSWDSSLDDIYKFDRKDAFDFGGLTVFAVGELKAYEDSGAAKAFDVSSPPISPITLLGSFSVYL